MGYYNRKSDVLESMCISPQMKGYLLGRGVRE